jgi:predicted nucleic acid-binding protein
VRLYFDTSALNRPFDDLSVDRVRLEAEAVALLIGRVESGDVDWVSSEVLEFELSQNPDFERTWRIQVLLRFARQRVATSRVVVNRARALEQLGLRGLDALHVAAAESARADLLVTTDDRMVRRTRRHARIGVRVVYPTEAVMILAGAGPR